MSRSVFGYLELAAKAALDGKSRGFRHGAVGLRRDGATVISTNLPTQKPERTTHAEHRLCRKLDWGSTVYVSRTLLDGSLAMSRPCGSCMMAMRAKGVKRVYYSIGPGEYGVIDVGKP